MGVRFSLNTWSTLSVLCRVGPLWGLAYCFDLFRLDMFAQLVSFGYNFLIEHGIFWACGAELGPSGFSDGFSTVVVDGLYLSCVVVLAS